MPRQRCSWLVMALLCGVLPCAAMTRGDDPAPPHWAFQTLVRPRVPHLADASRVRTPIDAFVLSKLQAKGLTFSLEADRSTLLRRAYFDLLGLPPSLEELEAFLSDRRPNAYEALLDRLLASPHFGERWGRHWLDEAGYVDVTGTDNDAGIIRAGENKWQYRDYVVRSFNSDKPFDRFLVEQLAGDELDDWRSAQQFTPEMRELLIATGFLRTASDDTDENELNTMDIRFGVLHRTIEVVAGNLLGMTLQCAKCHDHKYEPISQEDYYRFQALFQPAFNPHNWLQPKQRQLADIAPVQKASLEKANDKLRQEIEGLKKLRAERKGDDKTKATDFDQRIRSLEKQIRTWSHVQAVYDAGPPMATHVLRRGQTDRPGAAAAPGFFSVLSSPSEQDRFLAGRGAGNTSGRRLALARWLTDSSTAANSLVLRVRVNRVWQHLFGQGLVATSENLGVSGVKPSHPELLDWLSMEFRAGGQRLKPLLKLMMTSAVYMQSAEAMSIRNPELGSRMPGLYSFPPSDLRIPVSADPDNQLLWRMRLRRLESEAIRDAVLTASGRLDRTLGGAPIPVEARPDGTFVVADKGLPSASSATRRSLYLLARRNYHPTVLNVFDQPNLTTNCARRTSSAVVLQTLTMLNDPFFLEQAGHLAERVRNSSQDDPGRVAAAFRLTLTRDPTAKETQASLALLQRHREHYLAQKLSAETATQHAWRQLCHMLFNTSEFLYVP